MWRLALCATGLLTLLGASSAQASITIGQLTPPGSTPDTCGPSSGTYTQPTVTSGRSYVVPPTGVRITSWSTVATSTPNQRMMLQVLRPLGGAVYLVVTHDGPHPLTPAGVNTFQTNLAVRPGDVLGVNTDGTSGLVGCRFLVAGETGWGSFPQSPRDGQSATFTADSGARVNVTAEVEPSNAFSIASTRRNKKKGKATLSLTLPGPGTATLVGAGLKTQSAALTSATGGSIELTVAATGKARKKLRKRGKASVSPSVTFSPTGGTPSTQSQTLKLIKKRKR